MRRQHALCYENGRQEKMYTLSVGFCSNTNKMSSLLQKAKKHFVVELKKREKKFLVSSFQS